MAVAGEERRVVRRLVVEVFMIVQAFLSTLEPMRVQQPISSTQEPVRTVERLRSRLGSESGRPLRRNNWPAG